MSTDANAKFKISVLLKVTFSILSLVIAMLAGYIFSQENFSHAQNGSSGIYNASTLKVNTSSRVTPKCISLCSQGPLVTNNGGSALSGSMVLIPVLDSTSPNYISEGDGFTESVQVSSEATQAIIQSYSYMAIKVLPPIAIPLGLSGRYNTDKGIPAISGISNAQKSGLIPAGAIPVILVQNTASIWGDGNKECGIHLYPSTSTSNVPIIYVSNDKSYCYGGISEFISHEIAETITNPNGTGWATWGHLNPQGLANEIADECSNIYYKFKGYSMSSVYLNSLGGCSGLS